MSNTSLNNDDYKVADISLADYGRKEIELAEAEMPALMALRTRYANEKPLANAKILGWYSHDHSNSSPYGNID